MTARLKTSNGRGGGSLNWLYSLKWYFTLHKLRLFSPRQPRGDLSKSVVRRFVCVLTMLWRPWRLGVSVNRYSTLFCLTFDMQKNVCLCLLALWARACTVRVRITVVRNSGRLAVRIELVSTVDVYAQMY